MSEITANARRIEHLRQTNAAEVGNEVHRFYAPFHALLPRLRTGDEDAIERALQFLEADPWCFGSGFMKADLMHALANGPDLGAVRGRVQQIVLHRLQHPEPRLLRHAARLSSAVWDDLLRNRVETIAREGDPRQRSDAEALLRLVEQHRRSTQA